jgi:hypothetical protein
MPGIVSVSRRGLTPPFGQKRSERNEVEWVHGGPVVDVAAQHVARALIFHRQLVACVEIRMVPVAPEVCSSRGGSRNRAG